MNVSFEKIEPRHNRVSRPRVYVWYGGETVTVLKDLMNRRSRPVKLYRELVSRVFKQFGIENPNLHWRQNAGCSCGCSPGFIYYPDQHHVLASNNDMHISFTEADVADPSTAVVNLESQ
jgi:hypothetical protein